MRIPTAGLVVGLAVWNVEPRAHAATVSWEQLPGLVAAAPATKAEQAEVEAAEARTGHLGRSWQPRIVAGTSGLRQAVNDPEDALEPAGKRPRAAATDAAVTLNLWRGGRDSAHDGALGELAEARRRASAQRKADRLLSARRAWLEAWRQTGVAGLLAVSTELTRANRERAARKARSGLTTQSDVVEFDLRLLSLEQQAAEVGEAQRVAEAELASLLGVSGASLGTDGALADWPPAQDAPASIGLLELSLSGEGRSLGLESRSLGRWPYPEFEFGLIAGQGGRWQSFPAEQQLAGGLGLTLSLWDGGATRAERRALDQQAESLSRAAAAAGGARAALLGLTTYRLQLWLDRADSLNQRIRLATEFRTGVSEEYLRGAKDSRDLEDATREVYEAGEARLDAQVKAWDAWAVWQNANAR